MLDCVAAKYFEEGTPIRLIEGHTELIPIDVYDKNGVPIDLSTATPLFHIMEFSTRSHILTKECEPYLDTTLSAPGITYPYSVPVYLESEDTIGLDGDYVGQLELIDFNGNSKWVFQTQIIITKNAAEKAV